MSTVESAARRPPKRHRTVRAWDPLDVFDSYDAAAARRQIPIEKLIARVLEQLKTHNAIDAVMDDGA